MIRCLHVRNLAIVKEATLDLGPGLNLLTGETGAGKSILVDALLIGLGARGDADFVRGGEERGSVAIEFDLAGHAPALAFLSEHGYAAEPDGSLLVRREITTSGRGRAFIGSTPAPVSDLRALGALTVAVHGQHQHQVLLDPSRHRGFLDRQAGLDEALVEMEAAFGELDAARARLLSLRDGSQRLAQRIDLLAWQVQEIEAAAVQPGERGTLRAERERLRHAETILRHGRLAVESIYEGDGAALARLAEGIRAAREVARYEPGLDADLDRVEAARSEIEEVAFRLRDLASRLQPDPVRLQAVDDRVQLIEGLLKKYAPGGDEAGLLAYREAASAELRTLTDGSETVSALEARVTSLSERTAGLALDLSRRRRAAAQMLERRLEAELGDLAMSGTRFAVEVRLRPSPGSGVWIEGEEVAVDAAGCDVVEFLLSANRGEALRPLAAVASGGELSRLMLGLEVVLLGPSPRRTLVFDEVDAGVGGAVAEILGRKLKTLALSHQVLCVTHLAPIAAQADRHARVSKRAAGPRTEVAVEPLDAAARVREIARMLAGETLTPAALKHAEEMLQRGVASEADAAPTRGPARPRARTQA
jgi:DNA repair protein RecN (Recombination protein N)